MSQHQHSVTLLAGFTAIATFVAPAGAQVTSWPNSLSMTVDVRVNPPMLTLKVGPVAPNAWVAFLGVQGNKLRHLARANDSGYYTVSFPTTVVPVDFELAVYSLSNGTPSFEGTFIANPSYFDTPPMPTLGAPDINVFPDRVEILNGAGTLDDEVIFTSRPLVEAIRQALSGDVIGVYGDCTTGNAEPMWLGGAQDANKYHHVHWGDDPMHFAVVGMTPDAKITGFAVARGISYDGTPTAGIGDVLFSNLTMQNSRWSQMAIAGNKGVTFGRLRLYNMHFEPHPARLAAGNDGGFGAKWWIRVPSWGSWDVRNCSFEGVQEHSIYIDSPQGDNFFDGIEHTRSWRTAIQIVNRAWELPNPPQGSTPAQANAFWNDLIAEYESGAVQPAPSGQGRILIRDVNMQGIYGEGGSGVTVVGFDGDVYLENVTAVDDGPFHGAIVLWTDAGIKHGVHLFTGADGNLYSIRRVFLINPTIDLPQADRDLIAIAGAEEVHIINFDIAGNRPAIALSSTFGTPNMQGKVAVVDGQVTRLPDTEPLLISNGHEEFYVPRPVSQYAGFRAAGKVRLGAYLLSDAEIDSRWP